MKDVESSVRPKVLVIGDDLPHLGKAGSILLHRLFQNWPDAALLSLGPTPPEGVGSRGAFVRYDPPLERWVRTRFDKFVRFLRTLGPFQAGHVEDAVPASFKPAAMVHVLSTLGYSESAYHYSRRTGLPLVLIVHDDPEDFNGSYPWARRFIRRRFERIYRHASRRLCISPEMVAMMRERYGAEGEVMYPNRSEFTTPRPPEAARRLKVPGRLTLGYAGGLAYGYGPRLLELVPLLREARTTLRVYGGSLPADGCEDVLVNMGRINTPELLWERVKEECDAVLLPYCFPNHGHQDLYRTHFPSKLPEYLALGMPVVVAGPEHATGVKWGLKNPEACVSITAQSGHSWQAALAQLRDDPVLRVKLATNAVQAGNRAFDPAAIREFFQASLAEVTRTSDS